MSEKDIILMIDDDAVKFGPSAEQFLSGAGYELVTATTLEEGRELYGQLKGRLAGIIMDGCVGEEVREPNSIPLVTEIRQDGFTGPIVAMSRDSRYCDRLVEAGCTSGVGNKHEAGFVMVGLLAES